MCISLFSALANAEKKKLTVSEAEKAVAGNLCRCTGYRPIADVCKSFAADVDLEDLGINSFWRKGDSKEVRSRKLPSYNHKDHVLPYSQVLNDECKSIRILNSEKHSWATPVTVEELRRLLDMAGNGAQVKLVAGNTGTGYYRETEKYDRYIDIRYIPELSVAKRDESGIVFGAALPISKAILYLKEEGQSNVGSGGLIFKKIAEHMEKIASGFVRNSASVGGNLIMAQRKCFPSDIATLLLAVGSTVTILTDHKQENITVEEFLYRPPLDPRHVLLSVHIPFLEPTRNDGSDEKNDSRLIFETYRAAPRPLGNALPYLNAAFLADVCCSKNGYVVNRVRLVFGAYGTKHAVRAREVEQYLEGKTLGVRVLDEAIRLVKSAV
ncbi:abscisic aldehyde oxidase 3, partial [Perilla frutescens var. frutescens]